MQQGERRLIRIPGLLVEPCRDPKGAGRVERGSVISHGAPKDPPDPHAWNSMGRGGRGEVREVTIAKTSLFGTRL